jgi:F0F1-type ATP synthase assembly protein I
LKQAGEQIRSASQALMIPSLLAAGPLVGYFVGRAIGGWAWDAPDPGGVVGVILGLIAGIREVVRVVRRMGKE